MRIYLPATAADLRAPEVSLRPAHAVTDTLASAYPDADIEELEFFAQEAAAAASLRILRLDHGAPAVRVVIAAEVDPTCVTDSRRYPSEVELLCALTWDSVVCVFADEAAARPLIDQARQQEEPQLDVALLWYDASEIDDLAQDLLAAQN